MFLRQFRLLSFLISIQITPVLATEDDQPIRLQVTHLNGKTYHYEGRTKNTMRDIADFIADKETRKTGKVLIVLNGNTLTSKKNIEKTIFDFGFQNDDTLYCCNLL